MTEPTHLRQIGDEVLVFDSKGSYECRGKIVGVYRCSPVLYDIAPNRAESLKQRLCGIPETRLRSVSRPILAYEKRSSEPVRILDEA